MNHHLKRTNRDRTKQVQKELKLRTELIPTSAFIRISEPSYLEEYGTRSEPTLVLIKDRSVGSAEQQED